MKYLLLKHYRGGPAPIGDWVPMGRWTSEEVDEHMKFMRDFTSRLKETGEFVESQALAPEGAFVRYDGEGHPPVTDGPFSEDKDLIAGWMIVDVDSWDRAAELAGETEKAHAYYEDLVALGANATGNRPELAAAEEFLVQ